MSRNTLSHPGLCQQAPSRWADPTQQATTRRLCMKCPRLQRCRRETLTEKRTFGMWAGVWIDHDLPAKRHLLQPKSRLRAIAQHPQRSTRVGPLPINELSPAGRGHGHRPLQRPLRNPCPRMPARPTPHIHPPDPRLPATDRLPRRRTCRLHQLRRADRTNRPRHRTALRLHHHHRPPHHQLARLLAPTTLGHPQPLRPPHRPTRAPPRSPSLRPSA